MTGKAIPVVSRIGKGWEDGKWYFFFSFSLIARKNPESLSQWKGPQALGDGLHVPALSEVSVHRRLQLPSHVCVWEVCYFPTEKAFSAWGLGSSRRHWV